MIKSNQEYTELFEFRTVTSAEAICVVCGLDHVCKIEQNEHTGSTVRVTDFSYDSSTDHLTVHVTATAKLNDVLNIFINLHTYWLNKHDTPPEIIPSDGSIFSDDNPEEKK